MPQAILFDLGKVLIDIDLSRVNHTLSFHSPFSPEEIGLRLWGKKTHIDFMTGKITAHEFWERMRIELELSTTIDETIFRRIYGNIFRYNSNIEGLLRRIKHGVRIGIISNIDMIHWSQAKRFPVISDFFNHSQQCTLSFLNLARKPNIEMFSQGCFSLGCSVEQTLLIDTIEEHSETFRSLGGMSLTYDCAKENLSVLSGALVEYKLIA